MNKVREQIARGDLKSAETSCRQILTDRPDDINANFFLAFILWQTRQPKPALHYCRQTLALKPGNAGLLSDLGNILRELGADSEALEALDLSLRLRPGHSGAVYNKALVLENLGREQEALKLIESISPGDPLFARARYLRGTIRQDFGDMSGAEADFLECIEAEPGHSGAWHALVSTRRFTRGEDIFDRLKSRLVRESGNASDRQRYLFALAKVYDDIGEYDVASDYLLQANRLVDVHYDRFMIEERLQRICEIFREILSSPGSETDGTTPVFIVGLPRSGTTLVETMLDRHPDIMAMGELELLPGLISDFRSPPDPYELSSLGNQYLGSLPDEASRSPLVLDKMPENFWRLGYIAAIFHGAKIIHCRRDLRDVALSNFFNLYAKGNSFAYRLEDLAHYSACYQAVMAHWISKMGTQIFEVDYARLVNEPGSSMTAMLEFLGQSRSEPKPADPPVKPRRIKTASNWQVRQKVYTSSVGRWKNYPRLTEIFMTHYQASKERIEKLGAA